MMKPISKHILLGALVVGILGLGAFAAYTYRAEQRQGSLYQPGERVAVPPLPVGNATSTLPQERPDTGPYTCGTPTESSQPVAEGWINSVSTYTCLQMSYPKHWRLAHDNVYAPDGQADSLTLWTNDATDEVGRPVLTITPVTEPSRLKQIVGKDPEELRRTLKKIGSAKLEVYDLGIEADEQRGHGAGFRHEYFVLLDTVHERTYVIEAWYFPNPFMNADFPDGIDFPGMVQKIVLGMRAY